MTDKRNTILVVDDDLRILKLLSKYLGKKGFEVRLAPHAGGVFEKSDRHLPDIILLDISLPGIDGFDIAARLKANEESKDIPIIFMSARTDSVDKVRGFELGAVDYITKPIDLEEVVARVNAHLTIRNLQKKLEEQNIRLEREIDERKQAEAALRESEKRFRNLFENSPDPIFVEDLDGNVLDVNPAACRLHGIERKNLIGMNVLDLVPGDQKEQVTRDFPVKVGQKLERKDGFSRTANGRSIPVEISASHIEYSGKPALLFHVRDMTERKRVEEKIKTALKEKEVLLKEIHHRVKNNLQTISSLLNLQSGYIKDKQSLEVFKNSKERVHAMALIHEKLYESRDLSKIDFREYICSLVNDLFDSYSTNKEQVLLKMKIEDAALGIETAIPLGLIINELVSNSLKYAFPGSREAEIQVKLEECKDEEYDYTLIVGDNGIGLPGELDFRDSKSLGMVLVCSLAKQLHGAIDLDRKDGTTFTIKFKQLKYNKRI